ncbi:MAG: glycoside hydrolase family 5 protein [Gaiellales bacterium]
MAVAVVALAAVAALVASVRGGGPAPAPPAGARATPISGWLHTSAGRIVDAAGHPVRLLGLDEPSLIGGEGNNRVTAPDRCGDGWLAPAGSEFRDFQRFGFNSVRLGLSWANLEPRPPSEGAVPGHHWNGPYLAALDAAVRGFTSHGIAVVLDMHQNNMSPAFSHPKPDRCQGSGFPVWLYPDAASSDPQRAECDFLSGRRPPGTPIDPQAGYADAWRLVARRYASNRMVVAADMFNEPNPSRCPALALGTFYRRLGEAIRAADPHLLLIYQDNAARRGNYALRRPLALPGAVYSFHFYPTSWAEGRRILDAHMSHVASWHTPVWLGEFGVFRAHARGAPVGGSWLSDLAQMMLYCRRRGIGWAFHQYAGGAGSLVSRSGGRVHADWLAALQAGF